MANVIEMPKLSDTMEEGGIANWLKKEGDFVKEGEALVEIETDKATQEYESPEEGILLKIIVQSGKTVSLRTPIAVLGEKGESYDLAAITGAADGAAKAKSDAAAAKTAADKPGNVVAMPRGKQTTPPLEAKTAAAPAPKTAQPTASKTASAAGASASTDGGRLKTSPLARKLADEHGLDLGSIEGSGPGGRVVMRDVEARVADGGASAKSDGAAAKAPSTGGYVAPGAGDQVLPVSMMRKTIAKRLLAAKNDAPHFYLTVSANMSRALEWRQRLNDEAAKSDGKVAKVSVNDLVILAVARALRKHPAVNSSWQGDTILQHGQVHVAMAVALPEGLVTPVIRDTDRLGVREIAAQARELATKAKDGKLGNQDYQGGTFTISNLGMFGIEEFTAIINPPQAAILAVGATTAVPHVDASGQVVAQQRMKVTMSCDHRVVDGSTGAQFLQTFVRYLEDPMQMIT